MNSVSVALLQNELRLTVNIINHYQSNKWNKQIGQPKAKNNSKNQFPVLITL